MAKKLRRAEARWIENRKHWKINVQADGGTRKSFYSSLAGRKGKVEAERKADDWLDANCPDNLNFKAAWSLYVDKIRKTTGTENYIKTEGIGRLYILPMLQHKKLANVTIGDMDKCIECVAEKGLSKRTCQNVRAVFVGFYRYCKKNNWHFVEPEGLTIPSNAPVGRRTILQPNEIVTLFTKDTRKRYGKDVPFFYIHTVRFAVAMGYRSGEERGFRQEDFSGDGKLLMMRRSINRLDEITPGKNENARRAVVLPKIALKILDDQRRMLDETGIVSPWLFPDEEGERLTNRKLYRGWRSYADSHGIKASLHELRHTWVSIMKATMPDGLLKSVVGHSKDMDTYGVYGHEFGDDLEIAAEYIDRAYGKLLNSDTQTETSDTTQNTTFRILEARNPSFTARTNRTKTQ